MPRIARYFILLGVIFFTYVCYALLMMNDHAAPWWNFFYGILFSSCIFCSSGLWNAKLWAWRFSLFLAMAALGLGLYFVHFAWTFWIFKEPTFFERVFAVFHPQILVFTVFPVLWLIYFLKPNTRSFFYF